MFAKSWAVELMASITSGNIKEPDKKVIVTPALIIGVTPNSLNRSRLATLVPAARADLDGKAVPMVPPARGSKVSPLITSRRFIVFYL